MNAHLASKKHLKKLENEKKNIIDNGENKNTKNENEEKIR